MARLIVNPTSANRREIPLARAAILTIGRDPSNDLVLPDSMVSRRHAVIEHRGSHFCPGCLQAFLDSWDEVLAIHARLPGEAAAALPACQALPCV